MPGPGRKFKPGETGNPKGRPPAAKGLREELIRRFGEDGKPLVDRLDALSTHRNPKVALPATELLVAYFAGKPTQQLQHTGADGGPVSLMLLEASGTVARKLARLAAGADAGVSGEPDAH
jgi:hypothetical protein